MALSSGMRFFVCRKGWKLVWKAGPLCIFWMIWKARNGVVFRNEVLSIQKLKFSVVNLLWSETDLFIENGRCLCQFIDWAGY